MLHIDERADAASALILGTSSAQSLFSVTVTHLSATATAAVIVVITIVAAAAEDDDKKNDPSAAIAVSVSEKVTHTLSSFRLHYHIIIKS